MASFENARGRRIRLELPEVEEWPELTAAVAAYRKLLEERRLAGIRLGSLEADRARSVELDKRDYGKAIREGKPDPGTKRTDKIDRDMADTRRRLEAIEFAISDAEGELVEVVEEHRADWIADADRRIGATRAEYGQAVEQAMSAHQRVAHARALRAWLDGFPAQPSFRVLVPFVDGLRTPAGERYPALAVWDALRQDAGQVSNEPSVAYGCS